VRHWIGIEQQETESRHGTFIAACAKAFFPDITVEAAEPLAALRLVAAELSVTMTQQSLSHHVPEGVVLHELPWFRYRTPLWAVWHQSVYGRWSASSGTF
jgi:DNA-binding transcriptional LysR family regulator